ncbi:hypothetical protein [Weissella confusa]|uniref:hypothetical protein n=1 Tax=Weissella confusa TaxID=1583 RepID=UPI001F55821F|nr:hypothetical protein [Weissella confusa]
MADVTYKITHLTVQGANKQTMRLFYRDILGLIEQEVAENEFSYAFTADEMPFLTIVFGGKRLLKSVVAYIISRFYYQTLVA